MDCEDFKIYCTTENPDNINDFLSNCFWKLLPNESRQRVNASCET